MLNGFHMTATQQGSQVYNSLFQRRVMERHLGGKAPVSLLMAIADHPWTKATRDAAAVRIAMTVAALGEREGSLFEVTRESGLDTDAPEIELLERRGRINSDLTIGADVTRAQALKSNDFVCSPGVKLHGDGFIVTPAEAEHLGLRRRPGLENHVRQYRNGRDLTGSPCGKMVIDLFGLAANDVRARFPEVYQHVLETVKESRGEDGKPNGRDVNNRESYRVNWWTFGEPRQELRAALNGLSRFIATPVTQKHRVFVTLDISIIPDDALMCLAIEDSFALGVLQSRIFVSWFDANGSTLEDRPRFIKSRVFDPFPFPDATDALKIRIRAAAEELDALRKRQQAEHPGLTLTQIYNVLEKLRAGARNAQARQSRAAVIASDSEAIQTRAAAAESGLLRFARNDGVDGLALTASSAKTWPPERHQRGDRP